QRDADGNRGAERVADDNRPPEPEVPGERADEAHPLAQRVRAVSLAVAEGREVDREDAVRATEARARLLPNEARHDEAAEQDDRAAAISPVPIGDELSVQANERPRIERGRRLHSSGGGRVVSHGRERHHDEQLEQDDAEPLRPASEAARHPPTLPANHVSEAPNPSPRSFSGFAIRSIEAIRPPATVKPTTAIGVRPGMMIAPAAPFTIAGRASGANGRPRVRICRATASAPSTGIRSPSRVSARKTTSG